MEPIELNGKTFCSNCGLTINNATPAPAATPTIHPIHQVEETSEEVSMPVAEPIIKAAPENAEVAPQEEEFEDLTIPEPVNDLPPLDEPVKPEETATVSEPAPEEPAETETNQETEDSNPPEEGEGVPQEIPIKTQSNFNPNDSVAQPDYSLTEAVKNVDALGASGILLDILNDNAVNKEKATEQEALEAANELIDQVAIKEPEKPEEEKAVTLAEEAPKMQTVSLPNSVKLRVNPVEKPEIEAAEEELEIEAPVENSEPVESAEEETKSIIPETFKADKPEGEEQLTDYFTENQEEEPPEEIESSVMVNGDEEAITSPVMFESDGVDAVVTEENQVPEEAPAEEAQKEPELVDVPEIEEAKINKDVADIFTETPKEDFTDLPSIKGKKHKTPKVIKEAAKEIEDEAEKPFVPDEIADQNNQAIQPPLKEYFNHFVQPAETPKKKKKAKKEKRNKTLLTAIIALLFIAAISFTVYTTYVFLSQKPEQADQTQQPTTATEAFLPTRLPVGYTKDGVGSYDGSTNTFTQNYVFTGDTTRSITFVQIQTDDPVSLYEEAIKKSGQEFQTKTVGTSEYAQLTDGSVFWTSGKYFYKLTVVGKTYKEQVYDMALSAGGINE